MTEDKDYDALSQKHLASIKRDMRVSLEDAAVRATHKVMAELEYERGFVHGAQHQMKSSVDKAVNAMAQREWVGLSFGEARKLIDSFDGDAKNLVYDTEAKLQEKNT